LGVLASSVRRRSSPGRARSRSLGEEAARGHVRDRDDDLGRDLGRPGRGCSRGNDLNLVAERVAPALTRPSRTTTRSPRRVPAGRRQAHEHGKRRLRGRPGMTPSTALPTVSDARRRPRVPHASAAAQAMAPIAMAPIAIDFLGTARTVGIVFPEARSVPILSAADRQKVYGRTRVLARPDPGRDPGEAQGRSSVAPGASPAAGKPPPGRTR